MNGPIKGLLLALGIVLSFGSPARAQYCNPASIHYIVRDERGKVLSETDLKSVYERLPKTIGDADTSMTEVSFASDGATFYRQESVDWEKGKRVPALMFANARTCVMHLEEVELSYHGKKMHLIFNFNISRDQHDRRPVVDSLRFQEGTFRLELQGWTHAENKLIPATRWKKVSRR